MNTTGMIRGYISKNMKVQEFEKQGFKFNRNRSQYIQYCFGIYINDDELLSM
ncbi:hypothetical protein [Clostridium estertheticum]|uniref:hypothetical protein n=1 Tax=Clostridium estertheticum TaxID=238834 RepID=UPI001C7CA454|nr:hypothetical protein [Clostridium estertheticum]MBX4270035.1 hypothetical protein [Clostridium estertheticum]WLC80242.1 hypothetical protein KTC98_02595 [Clostridium estertheticum]